MLATMTRFTEEEVREIMERYSTTREDAMTAPRGILDFMRRPPFEPTSQEIARGMAIARRIATST